MGFQTGIPWENASTVLDSNGTFYPYTVNTFGAWIQIRSIPKNTLAETNIFASENGWLEDDFPIGKMIFLLGRPMFRGYVIFRKGIISCSPQDVARFKTYLSFGVVISCIHYESMGLVHLLTCG